MAKEVGLEEQKLKYIVGVTGEMVVFQAEPIRDDPNPRRPGRNSRPPSSSRLVEDSARPVTLAELAARLPRCKVS